MTFDVSPKCVWVRIPLEAKGFSTFFSSFKSLNSMIYIRKMIYVVKSKSILNKMKKKLAHNEIRTHAHSKRHIYSPTPYPLGHTV